MSEIVAQKVLYMPAKYELNKFHSRCLPVLKFSLFRLCFVAGLINNRDFLSQDTLNFHNTLPCIKAVIPVLIK